MPGNTSRIGTPSPAWRINDDDPSWSRRGQALDVSTVHSMEISVNAGRSGSGTTVAALDVGCEASIQRGALMKSARRQIDSLPYSGLIRKGGRVALPPALSFFQLGQRIYFYIKGAEVGFQTRPKGIVRGHLLSSRIRRMVTTFSSYGPRTRNASRLTRRVRTAL